MEKMIDTFCAKLKCVYFICLLQQDNQIILPTDVFSLFLAYIVYNFTTVVPIPTCISTGLRRREAFELQILRNNFPSQLLDRERL